MSECAQLLQSCSLRRWLLFGHPPTCVTPFSSTLTLLMFRLELFAIQHALNYSNISVRALEKWISAWCLAETVPVSENLVGLKSIHSPTLFIYFRWTTQVEREEGDRKHANFSRHFVHVQNFLARIASRKKGRKEPASKTRRFDKNKKLGSISWAGCF